jgi:hypothetical protein
MNNNNLLLIKSKLDNYFKMKVNVLLEGRHGTGKTSLVSEIFNKNCKKWLYFSGATLDPWVDFIGIPKEKSIGDKEVLTFVLPEKMMDDDVEAIFIDEYNRSHKKVRNGTLELIQFKSINGKSFPNLKVVWAAINPCEDEIDYDVETLDEAQIDRFQVKIKMPNNPDVNYFTSKFGDPYAKAACEWWNQLPTKIQMRVSPRRLDYALEIYKAEHDIYDVIPIESNPGKLLTLLKFGNIEEKINKLYLEKNNKKTNAFFKEENNFQSAVTIIKKNEDYMHYFLPLLEEERLSSLLVNDQVYKNFIIENAAFFKKALESISKFKSLNKQDLALINRALNKVGEITVF